MTCNSHAITIPCSQTQNIKEVVLFESIGQNLPGVDTLMQGSRNNNQQHQLKGPSLQICKMSSVLVTNLGLQAKHAINYSQGSFLLNV